ncbi:hypothetical protein CLUG_00400 [Clavispora lusitaniae ATCC 42720]|uniref:Uncharacterized protein n=1 Tax=Clavispora lusitaniae (strain ATCC 42720) TaxID=306902 RepID=C4XWS7_CLAL4|nr:uncharacterized protein CLUG_00400 [Clavispora lusitaniae ATCC 42720]EEQ36277.1 hypothetical protein CLUG_00400 [Clavispora lusitaniae ATCC 42720]KAF5213216.1 hypothetical protein E0198_000733 [Clavispora lusitaniae]
MRDVRVRICCVYMAQSVMYPQCQLFNMESDPKSSTIRNKNEKLRKWGEKAGPDADDILDDLDGLDGNIANDFKTLRISGIDDVVATSSPVKRKAIRPSISPGFKMDTGAPDDEDFLFDEDFEGQLNPENIRLNQLRHTPLQKDNRFSPKTFSSASPVRRRSLSDYSEGTDTDITEMNEEDFEDIDDIFGKEESGIYSSGGKKQNNANISRASQILTEKKSQLKKQADLEDKELFEKYHHRHGEEVNTLRLKDLKRYPVISNLDEDPLENERTVNYEYTRDDNESFEDGFDLNVPMRLEATKLKQFQSQPNIATLSSKISMPAFPKSLKPSAPTKFRSTMDLPAQLKDEHPLFNNSNKIIRKLDRMPSFRHSKEADRKLSNDDRLNIDMERKKQQLLEKYMEITEKQKQLNSSPRRAARKQRATKKGVGLLKFLNDRTAAPIVNGNDKMRFNAVNRRWEGNDHDLLRFEEQNDTLKAKKQPALITSKEFSSNNAKISGNMLYDSENMRWVNLDPVAEENLDVFDEMSDLEPNDIPRYHKYPVERGVSAFTQRTTSTVSSDRSSSQSSAGEEFQLSNRLVSRFEKEEQKIRKKTQNWFGHHEQYRIDKERHFDSEYFWEIRKMVMDNSRG